MLAALLLLQAAAPASVAPGRVPQSETADLNAMKQPRRYDGVWVDAFEGQRFFEHAVRSKDVDIRRTAPWLNIDRFKALHPLVERRSRGARIPDPYQPRLYRIRFLGAEARDMNCHASRRGLSLCYGHMGMFPGMIRVDKVLKIEDLGPLSSDSPR